MAHEDPHIASQNDVSNWLPAMAAFAPVVYGASARGHPVELYPYAKVGHACEFLGRDVSGASSPGSDDRHLWAWKVLRDGG